MFSFFSKPLIEEDDRFLAKIQDATQRLRHLKHLYWLRSISLGLVLMFAVFMLIGIFLNGSYLAFGFLGAVELIFYLDADIRVKMIRIYEMQGIPPGFQKKEGK